MGCDIHLFAEIRKDGVWEAAGDSVKNEWYDHKDKETPDNQKYVREEFYSSRHYELFGILAGVRYTGFKPIVEPRGTPKDVSLEVKSHLDYWTSDGHTHSWLTLKEILEYMWSPRGKKDIKSLGPNSFFDGTDCTVAKLTKLALDPHLKPEDIRVVLFFDN